MACDDSFVTISKMTIKQAVEMSFFETLAKCT